MSVSSFFKGGYNASRQRFLDAVKGHGAHCFSLTLDGFTGREGETLTCDAALLGPSHGRQLIVMSSALHGSEGHAGAGCQLAAMADEALMLALRESGKSLLLIHGINPYGFSYGRRVNEQGIDLNRNFLLFGLSDESDDGYSHVHDLLVPLSWPPDEDNKQKLAEYIWRHGARAYQRAVSSGQRTHCDGLFYSGLTPAWSQVSVGRIFDHYLPGFDQVLWLDIHTGLGPFGIGQKILSGSQTLPGEPSGLAQARRLWGPDVVDMTEDQSVSIAVRGSAGAWMGLRYPALSSLSLALEFGTFPMTQTLDALRFDHWVHQQAHPERLALREQARTNMQQAFDPDDDSWRGMVWSQTRSALERALG